MNHRRIRKPWAVRRARINGTYPEDAEYRAFLRSINGLDKYGRKKTRVILRYGRFLYCQECGTRMSATLAYIRRADPMAWMCGDCAHRRGDIRADAHNYRTVLHIPASVWYR